MRGISSAPQRGTSVGCRRTAWALVLITTAIVPIGGATVFGDEIIRLPDGSSELLRGRGDDDFVFYQDESGYSLMRVKGHFEYAIIDPGTGHLLPSGYIKGQADPKSLGIPPGVRYSSRRVRGIGPDDQPGGPRPQPAEGDFNVLIVPMRFSNHSKREVPARETLDRIFNRRGGDPEYAPAGSVHDYMREVSYEKFRINFFVLPWIDLPKSESYYSEWDPVTTVANGYRIDEACFYALGAVDTDFPKLDLKQFDRNDDGYIDAVGFLHSGYGSEAGGTDPDGVNHAGRIDSMQYPLTEWTSRTALKVRKVAIVSAFFSNKGVRPVRVGVLAHEGGHMIGLPDLYNTRSHYEQGVGAGIGVWGLLGDSWGVDRSQNYALHMSPWSKSMVKWVDPKVIDQPGEHTIRAAEKYPDVYRIDRGFPPGEYLLIENRQPIGFDRQIPAGADGVRGGLAIWHIDDRKTSDNDPGHPGIPGFPENNSHLRVALLQADGRYDLERNANKGDGDDLFRATGVSEISPDTKPGTHSYQLGNVRRTGIRIFNVSESAETMTFSVDFLPTEREPNHDGDSAGSQSQPKARPTSDPQSAPRTASPDAASPDAASGQPNETGQREPAEAPRIVREVELKLERPAIVSISGTAVLRSTVAKQTAEIALAQETAMWRTSRRFTTFARTDQVMPLSTQIVREFPAGTHTLRLVLNTPEGTVDVEQESSLTCNIVGSDMAGGAYLRSVSASGKVSSQPSPTQQSDSTQSANDSAGTRLPFLTYIDLAAKPAAKTAPKSAGVAAASAPDASLQPSPRTIVWSDLGGKTPVGFERPGTVGSVTVTLTEPADVRFSASMSFASPGARNDFVSGLSDSDDPAAPAWPESQRTDTATFADQCLTTGSQCVRRLAPGTHTVHWRINPRGEAPTYAIGGGIITAEVFPVSTQQADQKE